MSETPTESILYMSDAAQRDADSVTLSRILDVLYLLLRAQDAQAFARVVDTHAKGGLISPDPTIDFTEKL